MKQLTKREYEIMNILWNSEYSLSSNEILNEAPELSIHTIQQVLRRLNDMGYIEVDGVGFTKNSITRKYKPIITQSYYFKDFMADVTKFELTTAFIKENEDIQVLDELEELIKEQRSKLRK